MRTPHRPASQQPRTQAAPATTTTATQAEATTTAGDTRPPRPSTPALDDAIARSVAFVTAQQLPTGAWLAMEDFEPRTSALHVVTLAFIGRLPLAEGRAFVRFLLTVQREDGSFPPYPTAPRGELCATALAWAALVVGDPDNEVDGIADARTRAQKFVAARGGLEAVLARLHSDGDLTAVYVAMAGLLDPHRLPAPRLSFLIVPGVLDFVLTRVNAGVVQVAVFVAAVTRALRARTRPTDTSRSLVEREETKRAVAFVHSWLNPNGNNNGTTVQTDLAIATLVALGESPESPRVASALSWFGKLKLFDGDRLRLRAFTNENWTTALALRALLLAGVPRTARVVTDGLDYLCATQSRVPMPLVNLRRSGARREGGWGFEEDNLLLPDTDDTGTVLSALGLALDQDGTPLSAPRRARVQRAVDLGLENLLDMQSDDGGWAGFVWNLGSKGPGPLFVDPVPWPDDLADAVRLFTKPPPELQEVPVEGLTGRVLQGLARCQLDASAPAVQRAARFLRERQCDDGSFWARWLVGYVAATSCVLSGLADCGWNMHEAWLERATRWLLDRQNADGSWGETPEAFEHPTRRTPCPGMPPLSGIALQALVDVARVRADRRSDDASRVGGADNRVGESLDESLDVALERAIDLGVTYLLAAQQDDGSWDNADWLQIYEPQSTYYRFDGDAWYRPLEALARERDRRARGDAHRLARRTAPLRARAPVPVAGLRRGGAWSPAGLRSLRAFGDPPADTVIEAVFREGAQETLAQVMGTLVHNDDPVPAQLPPPARRFFDETAALPPWADAARIVRGQRLFTRHGWLLASALFCSSLPQAYCAGRGAAVLTATQGMTRHVYRRVLETAQFVFDVCGEGNLDDTGVGVRAAQKVRLMHAAVRRLLLAGGEWDTDALGVPVNQEDLAGTLMTFSVVLLDGLTSGGVRVDAEDADAFLHLWRVVGHLLGVHEALLPTDVDDARCLMQAIREDQWCPSEAGPQLARDLVTCVAGFLPGEFVDGLPVALIHHYTQGIATSAGTVSSLLGLDPAPTLEAAMRAGAVVERALGGLTDDVAGELVPSRLVSRASAALMRGLIDVQREGKSARFRIPTTLRHGWPLEDDADRARAQ